MKQKGQTAGLGPCFHLPGQPILEIRFLEPLPKICPVEERTKSRQKATRLGRSRSNGKVHTPPPAGTMLHAISTCRASLQIPSQADLRLKIYWRQALGEGLIIGFLGTLARLGNTLKSMSKCRSSSLRALSFPRLLCLPTSLPCSAHLRRGLLRAPGNALDRLRAQDGACQEPKSEVGPGGVMWVT